MHTWPSAESAEHDSQIGAMLMLWCSLDSMSRHTVDVSTTLLEDASTIPVVSAPVPTDDGRSVFDLGPSSSPDGESLGGSKSWPSVLSSSVGGACEGAVLEPPTANMTTLDIATSRATPLGKRQISFCMNAGQCLKLAPALLHDA